MSTPSNIRDCMRSNPLTINLEASLVQAIEVLVQEKLTGITVTDDEGRAVGMLSEIDCIKAILAVVYNDGDPAQQEELMLDVTNILSGACISGLAKQVAIQVSYDAPSILVHREESGNALDELDLNEHLAMVLEIRFEVQAHQFSCDLLICITERTAGVVIRAIDRLLDEL